MRQIQLFVQDSELGAGTRGASLGPGAVQAVSRTRKNELFAKHHPTRIFTNNRALDFPNKYPAGNFIEAIADSFSAMVDQASMLLNDGSFKIFLSGDHSVAGATVASLKKKNPDKRIGVVWIDAHADIHTPFTSPSGNIHGMPVAMSMGIDNEDCANKTPSEETISYWNSLKNLGGVSPKFSPEDLIYVAVRDTEQQEEAIM